MGKRADSEVAAKLGRARESYQEVLDATKHQDDKINRVLVGIAFLTTGAIAFLFRTDVLATTWRFGSHDVRFVKLMAGCYFALTVAAVILLLLSLSSELRLPRGDQHEELRDSYLYFTFIAGRTRNSWLRDWNRPAEEIDRRLFEQYKKETYNLAQRARLKYGRTDEATALFVLALMFLAAGFLLALSAAGPAVELTWASGVILAGVFAGHAVLQLSTLHRSEQQSVERVWRIRRQDPNDRTAWMDRRRRKGMRALIAIVPLYVVAVLLVPVTEGVARTLWAALAVAASAAGYLMTAPRWHCLEADRVRPFRLRKGARPYLLASLVAAVLAVLSWAVREPWIPLGAAAAVPVLLSTITVGRQLTFARRVAALADPDNLDRKAEIDDQLLPDSAPPPESEPGIVGATGQNGPRPDGQGEATEVTTAVRQGVPSVEDVLTEMLGHLPAPRSLVYVSQPITTGPVYVGLRRSAELDEEVLKAAAKLANRESSRALLARVRAAFAGQDVLDPSEYEEDGLAQHGYHSLWQQVIETYAKTVVFADGWQFSVGCCVELESALDSGVAVLDAALQPLPPAVAAELIAAALPELAEADLDVGPVRRAAGRARSLVPSAV
ncbi:MAG: hypothetical protein ACJ73E_06495 [Mycobacteriales bacterium]